MHECSADEDDADAPRAELVVRQSATCFVSRSCSCRPPGEEVDDPGQLRQPEDAFVRHVADVRHTAERQEMVLAHRDERNVAGEDELVVLLFVRERRE